MSTAWSLGYIVNMFENVQGSIPSDLWLTNGITGNGLIGLPNEQTDRYDWKHYLPVTSLAGVNASDWLNILTKYSSEGILCDSLSSREWRSQEASKIQQFPQVGDFIQEIYCWSFAAGNNHHVNSKPIYQNHMLFVSSDLIGWFVLNAEYWYSTSAFNQTDIISSLYCWNEPWNQEIKHLDQLNDCIVFRLNSLLTWHKGIFFSAIRSNFHAVLAEQAWFALKQTCFLWSVGAYWEQCSIMVCYSLISI